MRRAQLQTLEPVIIIVFLGILFAIGLIFFVRLGGSDVTIVNEREALATLSAVTTLPELSCASSVSSDTYCLDLYKARSFAEMNRDDPLYYFPLLGAAEITLSYVDLRTGLQQDIVLYDTVNPNSTVIGSSTFFTVHDSVREERHFAMLTIRRERT